MPHIPFSDIQPIIYCGQYKGLLGTALQGFSQGGPLNVCPFLATNWAARLAPASASYLDYTIVSAGLWWESHLQLAQLPTFFEGQIWWHRCSCCRRPFESDLWPRAVNDVIYHVGCNPRWPEISLEMSPSSLSSSSSFLYLFSFLLFKWDRVIASTKRYTHPIAWNELNNANHYNTKCCLLMQSIDPQRAEPSVITKLLWHPYRKLILSSSIANPIPLDNLHARTWRGKDYHVSVEHSTANWSHRITSLEELIWGGIPSSVKHLLLPSRRWCAQKWLTKVKFIRFPFDKNQAEQVVALMAKWSLWIEQHSNLLQRCQEVKHLAQCIISTKSHVIMQMLLYTGMPEVEGQDAGRGNLGDGGAERANIQSHLM